MQQKFIVACFFIATSVLAPIQWYLWIYSGSANANFYFGVTIAFGTAQVRHLDLCASRPRCALSLSSTVMRTAGRIRTQCTVPVSTLRTP